MATRPITGDAPVAVHTQAVQLTQIGIVLKTDLAVATAMVNVAGLSGKQVGAAIVGVDDLTTRANPVLYIASGPNPADPWIPSTATGVALATTSVAGVVKKAATQAASTATDVAGIVANFNTLLANLKASGVVA
ncbi:MAG: head fiber protein [Shewanella oncorhynchi]